MHTPARTPTHTPPRTPAAASASVAAIIATAVVLAACGGTSSPSPTTPSPSASASAPADETTTPPTTSPMPPTAELAPDAILLRFDAMPDAIVDPYGDPNFDGIGGNLWFVPGAEFTLYGDGTVIFRDEEEARAATVMTGRSFTPPPLSTAQLTAAQVAEVLDHAWTDGGLATALERYTTGAVDLYPSGTFEISVPGRSKRVRMDGLFPDPHNEDPEGRERLLALADYLRHVDERLSISAQPWTPDRYWGYLREVDTSFMGDPAASWPWPSIGLDGWLGGRRSLLPAEVEALGIGPVPGGFCCYAMSGPGGDDPPYTAYGLSIVPAFPDPIRTDAAAEVVTSNLVVRSAPGTGSSSQILAPALDAPQLLYVGAGPVAADGYDWYLVAPFVEWGLSPPEAAGRGGWVAAGGHDEEPWIAPVSAYCPPPTLDQMVRMDAPARLACYGGGTVTLEGTFSGCFVSDPVSTSPTWLAHTGCALRPGGDPSSDGAALVLRHPAGVNAGFGEGIRIEGHFDDPAALDCRTQPSDEAEVVIPELVVLWCRTQFVVTSVSPL